MATETATEFQFLAFFGQYDFVSHARDFFAKLIS